MLPTQALMNGGRNYNGPKVAKFLVGWSARLRPHFVRDYAVAMLARITGNREHWGISVRGIKK